MFVLNPPYLLYYPDADGDDVPDGDPEVLLEGFGIEDSHSVANNLRWGPDGWLYAAQGSTVTGQIKRYGTKDKPVHSMGQLIWRYHPGEPPLRDLRRRRRERVWCRGSMPRGGSTPVTTVATREAFTTFKAVIIERDFGKHGELSNPYAFGYFPHMQHHSVPRFTHTFIIYEGSALSAHYAGRLFGVGPLQSHVIISDVQPLRRFFRD